MRILGDGWNDDYLDEALRPGTARLEVRKWRVIAEIDDLYFVRQSDPRLLWNYVRDIGVQATLRKVASRRAERLRNQRFFCWGEAIVIEVGNGISRSIGEQVGFIAPSHPRCMERVVLPDKLIRSRKSTFERVGSLRYIAGEFNQRIPDWAAMLAGWSDDSGISLEASLIDQAFYAIEQLADKPGIDLSTGTPIRERTSASRLRRKSSKPKAALFGLGNYAKTVLLPSVEKHVDVVCIHEIDPLQMGPSRLATGPVHDSSPTLRDGEEYDVVFIAGFHHLHSDLAVAAILRGAIAVIEKPIATNPQQLQRLVSSVRDHDGRLFVCFQRRFTKFNDWIREDMGISSEAPISYHAIVYEVPLPRAHWYTWPNSSSRLISNGCHWIDHFLFINNFVPIATEHVFVASDGTINVSMELENGALFTMVLTDRGTPRIGLREHIELRASNATVTIDNSSTYLAERGSRVVRSAKRPKMESFQVMYDRIGQAIASGKTGDSIAATERSASAVLRLERALLD